MALKKNLFPAHELVRKLLSDHTLAVCALQQTIATLNGKYSHAATVDFLSALIRDHETIAGTLRRLDE